jgi:predicted Zn-dependent protease with MMP-like domain
MDRTAFESLVVKVIDGLPEEFRSKMENVDVTIEDLPSSGQLRRMRLKQPYQLLGLYEGVPRTGRGQGYTLVLPDKITIFQKSVEARCSTEKQIEQEIGRVVRHEIAHHFGLSDDALRKINRY